MRIIKVSGVRDASAAVKAIAPSAQKTTCSSQIDGNGRYLHVNVKIGDHPNGDLVIGEIIGSLLAPGLTTLAAAGNLSIAVTADNQGISNYFYEPDNGQHRQHNPSQHCF